MWGPLELIPLQSLHLVPSPPFLERLPNPILFFQAGPAPLRGLGFRFQGLVCLGLGFRFQDLDFFVV